MDIEVAVIKETEELVFDDEKRKEWEKLIEELDLEGQRKLIEGRAKSPIPFYPLNTREAQALKILLPRRESPNAYDRSPIPIPVLGAIALAEKESYFKELVICYDDVEPDPVVIGTTEEGRQYLLARWAEEKLKALDDLIEVAKEKWKKDIKPRVENKIREYQAALDNLDSYVEQELQDFYHPLRYL